jgi:hypothetical protein
MSSRVLKFRVLAGSGGEAKETRSDLKDFSCRDTKGHGRYVQ